MGFCLILAGLCGSAHAVYLQAAVTAYRVPDGKIRVDGNPERLWRALSLRSGAWSTLSFDQYQKLVLLQPQAVRNADPSLYVRQPADGSVSLLAAYDNAALYFLFLVKTETVAPSKTLCGDDVFWKADAPEVYLDPNAWVDDSTSYRNYFSADAGGLIFGTSPKTIQLAKPLNALDDRSYFRNRAAYDRFQVAAPPSGLQAVSRPSPSDTTLVALEMRIPYWGGLSIGNAPSKSMFISWGFNLYPDSLWGHCNANPLAYRWAKHYLNYDQAAIQPPGWAAGDSTHFDPTRSWDGWGRFNLSGTVAVDSMTCADQAGSDWNASHWAALCGPAPVGNSQAGRAFHPRPQRGAGETGTGETGAPEVSRDARGRAGKSGATPRFLP